MLGCVSVVQQHQLGGYVNGCVYGCMVGQGCGGVGMWVYECAGCDMGV